jgi:hypothetical protein
MFEVVSPSSQDRIESFYHYPLLRRFVTKNNLVRSVSKFLLALLRGLNQQFSVVLPDIEAQEVETFTDGCNQRFFL